MKTQRDDKMHGQDKTRQARFRVKKDKNSETRQELKTRREDKKGRRVALGLSTSG